MRVFGTFGHFWDSWTHLSVGVGATDQLELQCRFKLIGSKCALIRLKQGPGGPHCFGDITPGFRADVSSEQCHCESFRGYRPEDDFVFRWLGLLRRSVSGQV